MPPPSRHIDDFTGLLNGFYRGSLEKRWEKAGRVCSICLVVWNMEFCALSDAFDFAVSLQIAAIKQNRLTTLEFLASS